MKNIVVLTGAGISAESGIKTFRDANGLWENHNVKDVASPDGWKRNQELVLNFYNERRRQLKTVQPNAAHYALVELAKHHNVHIVTQNVDDLHERAGSTDVVHLHGELLKVRSTKYPQLVYDWEKDLHKGDLCEKGAQLRPHIVWFGEEVPELERAAKLCETADVIIIIGTSMQVYPAAGLVQYAPLFCTKYYIDPHPADVYVRNLSIIKENASVGVPEIVQELIAKKD